MTQSGLLSSVLIGAVASARSMTPMATLAAARFLGRRTPGRLVLLDHPVVQVGALAMGAGELAGDKMTIAPDRTVLPGMLARGVSAGIAGAALAPRGRERAGAALAIATAIPLSYLTLALRKRAIARIGQTRSGLIEDALVVAAGAAIVGLAVRRERAGR
jgi:uncharacterized membrane protein